MRVETEKSVRTYEDLPGPFAGVGVSHSMYMKADWVGKRAAKQEQFDCLKKAPDYCYSYMLCVVNDDNIRQIKVLTHTGWDELAKFRNACTDEPCTLWGRHV